MRASRHWRSCLYDQRRSHCRHQAPWLHGAAGGFLVPGSAARRVFLRRQYNAFLGLEPGGTAARLIEKAIDKGHVRAHPSANQTMIYHVGNRAFFEAIGEEDNRNRRWRQPYSIKIKLMGLDYVLAHRQHHYLATENEKLNYFCGTLGLKLDCLPTRIYRSQDGRSTTTRYFVDKFPLFLSGAPGAPSPVVQFCYVDGN